MDDLEIGSRHVIWINPFCCDIEAEVVAYDSDGRPIVRTVDEIENLTLTPNEYIFPTDEDRDALEVVERHFKEVYGEEL